MALNQYQQEYRSKLCSLEEAAAQIQSGDCIAVPPGQGDPDPLDQAIAQRIRNGELNHIRLSNIWAFGNGNPLYNEEFKNNVEIDATFVCGNYRWMTDQGLGHYMPTAYSDVPALYHNGLRHVDVFIAEVAPMDRHGYFNLSYCLSHSQTLLRYAQKVIFVVNENLPRVFGDTAVHISQVDHVVEHTRPLSQLRVEGTTKEAMAMAGYVSEMIPDGACLQVGVGNVPNAVTSLLRDKKDLGIHTELLCECMLDLIECGAVNNSKKTLHRGKSVFTLAAGTDRMYDYVDSNPGVEAYEVQHINDPYVIAQNKNMIAINATLQVDLTGQCCSESLGYRQYSGIGGQGDFCKGAYLSEGGKSFLCVNSTAKNGTISTIVPMLNPGAIVSVPRTEAMYIVTEYGVASMVGKSVGERTRELIAIAHPDFREDLTREARKMHLI